jgi:hypothetical protein
VTSWPGSERGLEHMCQQTMPKDVKPPLAIGPRVSIFAGSRSVQAQRPAASSARAPGTGSPALQVFRVVRVLFRHFPEGLRRLHFPPPSAA